eukprot:scaffold212209_cov30-Tisochrysis_lutea.AAC.4
MRRPNGQSSKHRSSLYRVACCPCIYFCTGTMPLCANMHAHQRHVALAFVTAHVIPMLVRRVRDAKDDFVTPGDG